MESVRNISFHKALALFCALAAFEGLLCAALLLMIPADPQSAWLWGYSRSRVLMLVVNLIGIFIFAGWFLGLRTKSKVVIAITNKLEVLLRQRQWRSLIVSVLFFMFIFALIYLIFAYSNLGYRVPQDAITAMEQVKAYLFRLAPLMIWLALLCLQALIMFGLLGYADKTLYRRIIQILSIIIFPVLLGVFWILRGIDPFYYLTLAKEDNLIEWLTVFFLILTAGLSFVKVYLALRNKERFPWFYLLFGVACLLFALEEISWGQRIFGIESTKFFLENSDQQEINVHNVVNEWFSIRTKHVAAFALFIYGVVLPVLALNSKISLIITKLAIVVPPKVLIPGFTLASLMTVDRFFNGQDEEVAELFFSLCLFLVVVQEFFRTNATSAPQVHPSPTTA